MVVAPEAEPDVAEPEPDAGDSFAELWEVLPIGLELELVMGFFCHESR